MQKRGMESGLIDEILKLDKGWRELTQKVEAEKADQKKLGKEDIETARSQKAQINELEKTLKPLEEKRQNLLFKIPNLLHPNVHEGKSDKDNKVLRSWGEPKTFSFKPKDHEELGKELSLLDKETAAKVSGSRFVYLRGDGALLQMALMRLVFDTLTDPKIISKIAKSAEVDTKPFIPVFPPVMIKPSVYTRMGRLSEEDRAERYKLADDELYLIGSAEHTLGPMHLDEALEEKNLPIRYLGYSSCFRREAGSYGKDTKGIFRLHQFDKLEIESFTAPEDSEKEHLFFVAIQEYLMQQLEIPYQVVQICSGDMGKPDYNQIDINAWIPSQEKYRETHTADLMTDYQSRRLKTRAKMQDGSKPFVHMVDATAFAIGRTLIALLENHQTEKGAIKIPKKLQKYLGKKEIK